MQMLNCVILRMALSVRDLIGRLIYSGRSMKQSDALNGYAASYVENISDGDDRRMSSK